MHFSLFLTTRSTDPSDDRAIMHAMVEHAKEGERRVRRDVPAGSPLHRLRAAGHRPVHLRRLPWRRNSSDVLRVLGADHCVAPSGAFRRAAGAAGPAHRRKDPGRGRQWHHPGGVDRLRREFPGNLTVSVENLEIVERLWRKKPDDAPVVFDNGTYKGAVVSRIVPRRTPCRSPTMMSVAARPCSVERAARWPNRRSSSTSPRRSTCSGEAIGCSSELPAYRTPWKRPVIRRRSSNEALEWTTHSYQFVHVADTDEQAEEELDMMLEQYQRTVEREYIANKAAEAISGIDLPPRRCPTRRLQGDLDPGRQPGHRHRTPAAVQRPRHRQRVRRVHGRTAHPGAEEGDRPVHAAVRGEGHSGTSRVPPSPDEQPESHRPPPACGRAHTERPRRNDRRPNGWSTPAHPAAGIGELVMHGRAAGHGQQLMDERETSTLLPSGTALAATWDPDLVTGSRSVVGAEARDTDTRHCSARIWACR